MLIKLQLLQQQLGLNFATDTTRPRVLHNTNTTTTASHLQATVSKLLTYCVLRPTQPPTSVGREMSSSLRAMG